MCKDQCSRRGDQADRRVSGENENRGKYGANKRPRLTGFTAMNGKMVEVDTTDTEGRLNLSGEFS